MMNRMWVRTARRASVLLAVLVSTGCATKRDVRDLGTEIQDLARRQDALLAELQAQGMATQDTLRSTTEELFDIRGDVVRQLNTMSEQLDRLTELVGQNSVAIQAMRDAMDQLRRTAGGAPRAGNGPGGEPVGADLGATAGTANYGEQADRAYSTAINLLNRGSLTAAEAAFRDFLENYPRDELAPQAHFKLADVLEQSEDLDGALEEFERIPELFPTDRLVPDALYRSALVHLLMDEEDNARSVLRRLINTWPDASVTPLAQDRLDELGGLRPSA